MDASNPGVLDLCHSSNGRSQVDLLEFSVITQPLFIYVSQLRKKCRVPEIFRKMSEQVMFSNVKSNVPKMDGLFVSHASTDTRTERKAHSSTTFFPLLVNDTFLFNFPLRADCIRVCFPLYVSCSMNSSSSF